MSGTQNVELGLWSADDKRKSFVIKIQLSLVSSGGQAQILVYNEDKSFLMQGPPGKDIVDVMAGRPKVFFEAVMGASAIEIGREIPDPGW